MKRIVFWIATCVALLTCGCASSCVRSVSIGEEFCRVGCSNLGARFFAHYDHTCVCEFDMPHVQGKADATVNECMYCGGLHDRSECDYLDSPFVAIPVPPRRVVRLRSIDRAQNDNVIALARTGGIAYTESGVKS